MPSRSAKKETDYQETIERENYEDLRQKEFESTLFEGCTFIDTDMREARLIDCLFSACTLSSLKIEGATLQVKFLNSKIEGVNFFTARGTFFSVEFDRCLIRHVSFAAMKLFVTKFTNCEFQNVDFAEADLTGSDLSNCTFKDCTFQGTNLSKCDLRGSRGYMIDPRLNKLSKARFDLPEAISLLYPFDIRLD